MFDHELLLLAQLHADDGIECCDAIVVQVAKACLAPRTRPSMHAVAMPPRLTRRWVGAKVAQRRLQLAKGSLLQAFLQDAFPEMAVLVNMC